MKKVIKLKESDLQKIVKRVIAENYGYDEYISNIQIGDIQLNEHRDYIKRKLKDILRPPKCEECGEYEEVMYSDYGLEPEPTNVCTNKECSKSDWYYGRHLKENYINKGVKR